MKNSPEQCVKMEKRKDEPRVEPVCLDGKKRLTKTEWERPDRKKEDKMQAVPREASV